MNRRSIWTLLLIGLLVIACGPEASPVPATDLADDSSETTEDESATRILRFAVSNMDRDRYDNLIDTFEAENPDVHIITVPIEETLGTGRGMGSSQWPDDAYLLLAEAADVIGAPATRQAVQQGALLDLTNLFESGSNLTADSFYPDVLDAVQWDGGIWSLPIEASYALIYYNPELFDASGVAYPEPGWTWDDFLATAQALTIRDGDVVSQWGFVQPAFDPLTFVQSKAGLLFNPETSPPSAALNSPAVVDAVRWYTDLFLTYQVAPYVSSSEETGGPMAFFDNEAMQAINDEQAAMWYGIVAFRQMRGPGRQQQSLSAVPFPVDSPGDHTSPVVVDGLSISAGTQKADLAWQWITFLAQQSGRRGGFAVMTTSSVPAQPSVAAAAGYWDSLDEEYAAALQYAIDHAYVDTYDGEGYDIFYDAVLEVMDNGKAIEAALTDAQTEVEAELEAEAEAAPTPVADLVVSEEMDKAIEAGAVIIQFGMSGGRGPFAQESLAGLVDEFQAANPDVVVELETPQGFRGGLGLTEMAAEYDCFQASPSFSEDSLSSIINIEPFLAADPDVGKDDFFPSVLDQFTYQGQVWGLPGNVTVSVMNYNKDLFDAAQIPYPDPEWTTSDFLEAAVALTQGTGEDKQYGYVPSFSEINDLVTMMDRWGADMLDDSEDPPRLVFNSPEVIDAVRWYASLSTEHQVTPVIEQQTGDPGSAFLERQTLIDEGRAAMWTDGGAGVMGGFRMRGPMGMGATELNTGVVPLPAGPNSEQGSGFQSVDGYFISAQTEAREACWKWITFLTERSTSPDTLPARRSVAESAAYRQEVGAETADAYLASVSSGSQASFFQRLSEEDNWLMFAAFWLSDAYDSIINGEMTVEDALNDAQEQVDAYRECIIVNDAFDDSAAQQECSGQVGGPPMGPP